ncbi:hypothetical protein IJG92_00045 [Candidatus Saccharibacteria bacterium]|nr:hypothetical protein [Candidatus Saccharibacteria bacterium]
MLGYSDDKNEGLRKTFEDKIDYIPLKWKPDNGVRSKYYGRKATRMSFEDERNPIGWAEDDEEGRRGAFSDAITLL